MTEHTPTPEAFAEQLMEAGAQTWDQAVIASLVEERDRKIREAVRREVLQVALARIEDEANLTNNRAIGNGLTLAYKAVAALAADEDGDEA